MQTPWGDITVRDSHAHLFSHNFLSLLAAQKADLPAGQPVETIVKLLGWDAPPENPADLAARWVEEMDRHGVSQIALMASLPGDEDSAAKAVCAFPERIHGYFMLNPLAPDALDRTVRAIEQQSLKGICLFPAMHRYSVQDDRLKAIYQFASEQRGVIVFVHMGVLTVGVRKKLGLPSKFDLSCSNPLDLHRVALEYPGVNFVIPHFGAGFLREILMLGDLTPNVYLDTSSTNSWVKYQVPPVDLKQVFAQTLDIYGPSRLLFGSDSSFFPRGWNAIVLEVQLRILEELHVKREDVQAVLGGNLQRLLEG